MRPAAVAAMLLALLAAPALAQDQGAARAKLDLTEIRRLPVLASTRFQPLESYAREVVLMVTGEVEPKRAADGAPLRRDASGPGKRGDAVLTYLEWWLTPDEARTIPWILINRPGARKLLGFQGDDKAYKYVSFDELAANEKFRTLVDELLERPRESLNLDEAEVLKVNTRAVVFQRAAMIRNPERLPRNLQSGPLIVPPRGAMERGVLYEWQPVGVIGSDFPGFDYGPGAAVAIKEAFGALERAFRNAEVAAFPAAARALRQAIEGLQSPEYPDSARIDREVRYHRGRYFDHAAWLYLASFILAIFAAIWKNRVLHVAAALPGVAALALNVYGLAERTALSQRALLGNLYETLLYLGAVAFLLALVCEGIFRSRWFLLVGSLLAMGFLRVAQEQALVMNPAISVLQPVLDNNFWIHIHVPVIVASYAPLMLAALMGNLYLLVVAAFGRVTPALKEIGRIQYWAMIPGVILLFAGLILGGIWADQSWGRFWGWDPKETWGLITWLVFVVLIHGRWSGWLRDFGTAVGAVIGGASLVMTYWGVNFLLPGLHSYAAADAAMDLAWYRRIPMWVLIYAGTQVALVAIAAIRRPRIATAAPMPEAANEAPEPEHVAR